MLFSLNTENQTQNEEEEDTDSYSFTFTPHPHLWTVKKGSGCTILKAGAVRTLPHYIGKHWEKISLKAPCRSF